MSIAVIADGHRAVAEQFGVRVAFGALLPLLALGRVMARTLAERPAANSDLTRC